MCRIALSLRQNVVHIVLYGSPKLGVVLQHLFRQKLLVGTDATRNLISGSFVVDHQFRIIEPITFFTMYIL